MLQITMEDSGLRLDIYQFFANPIVLEIIIGLVTVVFGTLIANKYDSRRKRAIIEITPAHSGNRLGFAVKTKKRTVNHPTILFYGGFTRTEWGGDLHSCDRFDEDGNPIKEDFMIAGGKPNYIFPLVAKTEWKQVDDYLTLIVRVFDSTTHKEVHVQEISDLPKNFAGAFSYPKEPKPSGDWRASVQVIAEGLEREEFQRFHLALETIVSRKSRSTYRPDKSRVSSPFQEGAYSCTVGLTLRQILAQYASDCLRYES